MSDFRPRFCRAKSVSISCLIITSFWTVGGNSQVTKPALDHTISIDASRGSCGESSEPNIPYVVVDPGSVETAWSAPAPVRSIYEAFARAPGPGRRVIYLRTGNYQLRNSLLLDAASDGLTIAACPGETPVIEASDDVPAVIIRKTTNVTLVGLLFSGPSPTHVVLESARECVVEHNTFLHGGTAILLLDATHNAITHNFILHPKQSGIELRDRSNGNLITDNIVDGADASETRGGGIFLHGTNGNRIAHNLIQNSAGFGVGVLNWDEATLNVGNIIEYNLIRESALTSQDSGAIYVLGRSAVNTQIIIADNVIDGVGATDGHQVGIYLDDSTSGALVTRNLIRRVGRYAVQIHGGSDNLVENNLLDLGEGQPAAVLFQSAPADTNSTSTQTGNAFVRNVILSAGKVPHLFDWIDGGNPRIAGNLFATATGGIPAGAAPITDTQPVMTDSAIAREPARDHYATVQEFATKIGFRPIDYWLAGPRPWRDSSGAR
jgi:Right handed beta helix region